MGNCKSSEKDLSVIEDRFYEVVNSDQKEYRKYHSEVIQRFVEANFDIVDRTIQNNLYSKIYHSCEGINKRHIDDTIKSYVDYMILWSYRRSKGQPFEILPPFNIEFCLRIHILYSAHFKVFLKLLKGPHDFKFDYEPKKMIPSGDMNLKNKYAQAYNHALTTLGKGHCDFIWEHPQKSFLKNEFSFCFTSPERKTEFNEFHKANFNVSKMKSFEPEDVYAFANNYRRRSGLENINEIKGKPLPTLADKFVINPNAECLEVAKKIDQFKFPENFMATLMWEQMIGLEEAMKWMLEYKKFLFLLFIEGKRTIISPSEKVDQVWHLHLQHYQNYIETVGSIRFIDHGPSKGGKEEHIKFSILYDQTVEFIVKYFGSLDINAWPNNGEGRYGEQGVYIAFIPHINKKLFARKLVGEDGAKQGKKGKKNSKKKGKEIHSAKKEFDDLILREE